MFMSTPQSSGSSHLPCVLRSTDGFDRFLPVSSPSVLVKSDANDRSSRIQRVDKPVQYPVESNMKVRKALLTDAESVSRLLGQLGYQASPKLIRDSQLD